MRYLLTLSLIFCVGCGAGEQPFTPDENEDSVLSGSAPEGEIPTSVVKLGTLTDDKMFDISRGTAFGVPTQTFVIIDGELTERVVFFQDGPYYHLFPINWIDGELVEIPTVINVLDQRITPVEMRREAGGLIDIEEPLNWGDEIEVVIKDRFKYIREDTTHTHLDRGIIVEKKKKEIETEMIFAEIKGNLTRPRHNHFFQ